MLITQIIANYLKTNRRITVGGLGTFLKKQEGQEILFSEFIKDNDGVLHSLLIENGLKELEAVAVVDRFIFDMKYALTTEGQRSYPLPGLGSMTISGGALSFEYDPKEAEIVSEAEVATPPTKVIERPEPTPAPKPIAPKPIETATQPTTPPAPKMQEVQETINTEQTIGANKELFDSFANYASEGQNVDLKKSFDKWWIIIPTIAVIFALVAIFYWIAVEWMYGNMELPEFLDSILSSIFMNEGGIPGAESAQ